MGKVAKRVEAARKKGRPHRVGEWPLEPKHTYPMVVRVYDPRTGTMRRKTVYSPSKTRVIRDKRLTYKRVGKPSVSRQDMSGRAVPHDATSMFRSGTAFPPGERKFDGKRFTHELTLVRARKPKKLPKYHVPRIQKMLKDPQVSVRSVLDKRFKERHVYVRREGRSKLWRKKKGR